MAATPLRVLTVALTALLVNRAALSGASRGIPSPIRPCASACPYEATRRACSEVRWSGCNRRHLGRHRNAAQLDSAAWGPDVLADPSAGHDPDHPDRRRGHEHGEFHGRPDSQALCHASRAAWSRLRPGRLTGKVARELAPS